MIQHCNCIFRETFQTLTKLIFFFSLFFSELATSALQAKIDLFGPDSEKLVDLLILMAESYRALANYDEAEAFLNQVDKLFESVFV